MGVLLKVKILLPILLLFFVLCTLPVHALEEASTYEVFEVSPTPTQPAFDLEEYSSISITEFYPAPNANENEWVEFYNSSEKELKLESWYIDDILDGGSSPIQFSITLLPSTYTVFELPKNILNNSGTDQISLLDSGKNEIYIVTYSKTIKGSSIQKLGDLWFITANVTKGEPNMEIMPTIKTTVPSSTNGVSTDELYSVSSALNSFDKSKIFITEFMPNPFKGESEWVELYNDLDEDVLLENWLIDDVIDSGGSPLTLNLSLPKKSYTVFEITKSLLNNSSDQISLVDDFGNLIHNIKYEKSVQGSSIQKVGDFWYITQSTSKGSKNITYEEFKSNEVESKVEEVKEFKPVESLIENTPEVLGASTTYNPEEYKVLPYYPMKKPFTPEVVSNVTYTTQRTQKGLLSEMYDFFKKITW